VSAAADAASAQNVQLDGLRVLRITSGNNQGVMSWVAEPTQLTPEQRTIVEGFQLLPSMPCAAGAEQPAFAIELGHADGSKLIADVGACGKRSKTRIDRAQFVPFERFIDCTYKVSATATASIEATIVKPSPHCEHGLYIEEAPSVYWVQLEVPAAGEYEVQLRGPFVDLTLTLYEETGRFELAKSMLDDADTPTLTFPANEPARLMLEVRTPETITFSSIPDFAGLYYGPKTTKP
jgi:hypothetical protein